MNESNNNHKQKLLKIKNVDWFDTYLRKSIENNRFDVNEVSLEDFNEIHQNLKLLDSESSLPLTSVEAKSSQKELQVDHVKQFINQILEEKKDCMIRYNEIDALLKFIK